MVQTWHCYRSGKNGFGQGKSREFWFRIFVGTLRIAYEIGPYNRIITPPLKHNRTSTTTTSKLVEYIFKMYLQLILNLKTALTKVCSFIYLQKKKNIVFMYLFPTASLENLSSNLLLYSIRIFIRISSYLNYTLR